MGITFECCKCILFSNQYSASRLLETKYLLNVCKYKCVLVSLIGNVLVRPRVFTLRDKDEAEQNLVHYAKQAAVLKKQSHIFERFLRTRLFDELIVLLELLYQFRAACSISTAYEDQYNTDSIVLMQ